MLAIIRRDSRSQMPACPAACARGETPVRYEAMNSEWKTMMGYSLRMAPSAAVHSDGATHAQADTREQ